MTARTPVLAIPEPAVRLSITPIDDAAETTLITVQMAGPPAYMQVYAQTRAGVVTPIGRDDTLGKADSGGARRYRDGTVRLYVSEADPVANAPGSSSGITHYDYPSALPPMGSPGAGVDPTRITALETKLAQALSELNLMRGQIAGHETRLDALSAALIATGNAAKG